MLCHSPSLLNVKALKANEQKKRFSIQTDLLSWVHPEHATQSHGFRFGAGVCLAGQLCISQCRHTVSQERE